MPFLKIGVTCAVFHSPGTSPVVRDLLNIISSGSSNLFFFDRPRAEKRSSFYIYFRWRSIFFFVCLADKGLLLFMKNHHYVRFFASSSNENSQVSSPGLLIDFSREFRNACNKYLFVVASQILILNCILLFLARLPLFLLGKLEEEKFIR